ncbi:hypothetical protein EON73_03390 [bacterium]|nr:MAG: hypothetical protein EON73_03390 [bacterium]
MVMDFFSLSLSQKNKLLQAKVQELKEARLKNNLPIVYKTPECLGKPELFVYEYKTGQKELFAFNILKQRERTLLKYQ